MSQPLNAPEAEEYRRKQIEEYGTYVATEDIWVGNALGYREGDPVPVGNVKANGWEKRVKKVTSAKDSDPDDAPKTAAKSTGTAAKNESR